MTQFSRQDIYILYKVNSDFYPRKNLFLINLSLFRFFVLRQPTSSFFWLYIHCTEWWWWWWWQKQNEFDENLDLCLRDIITKCFYLLREKVFFSVWPQVSDGFIIGDREMSNAKVNSKKGNMDFLRIFVLFSVSRSERDID